jgi:RNA polymerase sigma factor (TIGR02999 family)
VAAPESPDSEPEAPEITGLLHAWRAGSQDALPELWEAVYSEVHRMARCYLRNERPSHTLQATALINEAYLKLAGGHPIELQDRVHFFALTATIMRRTLVDYARVHSRAKRGGDGRRVDFSEALTVSGQFDSELTRLDDALLALEQFDSRKARVVEMRYFGGLTAAEIATVLGVSPQTVHLDWSLAKAWLNRELCRR